MKGMMTVLKPEEMPKAPHFVILDFKTRHIPGDERSKTNPGHGYPARDEAYTEYRWTANRDVWLNEITKLSLNSNTAGKFIAFKATAPATIEMKAQVYVTSL